MPMLDMVRTAGEASSIIALDVPTGNQSSFNH
jgi:hypothetical protein